MPIDQPKTKTKAADPVFAVSLPPVNLFEQMENREAELLELDIRETEGQKMIAFALNGQRLWKFKIRNYHRWRGFSSFDAWAADPDNSLNASTAHLSVQVIDLIWSVFLITPGFIAEYNEANNTTIPLDIICRIGERKFQIIIPEIVKLAARLHWALGVLRQHKPINSNRLELIWRGYRLRVLKWLVDGMSLSNTELTNSVKYVGGWETYFSSPMKTATLREMTAPELLAIVCPPDAPESVVITVRGRVAAKPRRK